MKNYRVKLITNSTLLVTMAATVMFTVTSSVLAQGRPPAGMSERDRNLMDRERQLREIEKGSKRPVTREPRLALAQVNEDFARIQVIYKDMMTAISSDTALDFKRISEAAAEIKKRTIRLRSNLVFPESGNDEKRRKNSNEPINEELKPSLLALGNLIQSFVKNPVFQTAGVVDAQLAAKAKGDLDGIIELSDKIRKSADKLNKTSSKTH